jgi:hypothetical protein
MHDINCGVQAVTGGVAQDEEQGDAMQDEARLRLFANIYSNQVAHLTTGMRIGRRPPLPPDTQLSTKLANRHL